jgi:hypothetical protein
MSGERMAFTLSELERVRWDLTQLRAVDPTSLLAIRKSQDKIVDFLLRHADFLLDLAQERANAKQTSASGSHRPAQYPEGLRCALDMDIWPCLTAQRDAAEAREAPSCCLSCGALIGDRVVHDGWHARLDARRHRPGDLAAAVANTPNPRSQQ